MVCLPAFEGRSNWSVTVEPREIVMCHACLEVLSIVSVGFTGVGKGVGVGVGGGNGGPMKNTQILA